MLQPNFAVNLNLLDPLESKYLNGRTIFPIGFKGGNASATPTICRWGRRKNLLDEKVDGFSRKRWFMFALVVLLLLFFFVSCKIGKHRNNSLKYPLITHLHSLFEDWFTFSEDLELSATLSTTARAFCHGLCTKLGLFSKSKGLHFIFFFGLDPVSFRIRNFKIYYNFKSYFGARGLSSR